MRSSVAALFLVALLGTGVLPSRVEGQQDPAAGDSLATLTGRVVSAMSGGPLEGARVILESSGRGTFTDPEGRFTIRGVRAGRDTVRVGLMGFAEEQVALSLQPGAITRVTLLLSETVLRVEDISVEVEGPRDRGKLAGFYARKAAGFGRFVTPEEIEARDAQHPSDYLRGVMGVQVGAYRMGRAPVTIVRAGGQCTPTFWVDGVRNPNVEIDDLNPDDVLAIEVYRGTSETPSRFGFGGASCGTIVVWTREGRDERTEG